MHTGKSEWMVETMTIKLSIQGIVRCKNSFCKGYYVINSKINN